ncbi:MAG TPA: S8 family serine peptidase [Kiritimatiellia bacterium]|nr:S8 family serine peptidase [Kiritimatiellia bacterium]
MLRPPAAKNTPEAKILPLPAGAREWVVRRITKAFLKDVHDLFFDAERRRAMRASLEERLIPGGGPYVIIGHSQGSMIAYDVLSRLSGAAQAPDVRLFVTIGSPLGIKEVQDQLKKMTGQKELRVPKCVRQWLNVSDILDPVALDHRLANDYKPAGGVKVEDKIRTNPDSPAHPHSGSGYLRLAEVRDTVRDAVRTELFQPVTSFTIAREVARSFEAGSPVERHEVLIELVDGNLDEAHKRLGEELGNLVGDAEAAQIEHLKRFVAARLTRQEAEILATRVGELAGKAGVVRRVWRNSVKRALDNYSVHTVQALPAHEAYHAYGDGVEWAVLDTGLESSHPHFGRGKKSLIVAEHDCTRPGGIVTGPGQARDRVGHGTHVAGIVAGGMDRLMVDPSGRAFPLVGMAPKCNLRIYKVLDDNGEGLDSWIIRALDHIAEINERHARLVVHGVNLSLGGPFDATSYGCGFSPLCRELARLWRQGVLIVVAAGNEGMRAVYGPRETFTANMDLSISDPANMENCIAVGSVNKVNPHSYGVSYFSSRGPTADGRCKPDVVAPGEKILSCRHDFTPSENRVDDLYVEMSGTSMAAPHVSGILAAFLSKRSEFKGQPDRVKDILLTNCTDLKRDRTFQGAGLPNLVKMLVAT